MKVPNPRATNNKAKTFMNSQSPELRFVGLGETDALAGFEDSHVPEVEEVGSGDVLGDEPPALISLPTEMRNRER